MTVNQIIVLLDIYRGTETQKEIGTSFADSLLLQKLGLVEPSKIKSGLTITPYGQSVIDKIKYHSELDISYSPSFGQIGGPKGFASCKQCGDKIKTISKGGTGSTVYMLCGDCLEDYV